jgi:hypothetical protein
MHVRQALIQGAMYRVRVKIPGVYLVARESCMKLLDVSPDGEMLIFSARPRLGTQEIETKYVTELEIQPEGVYVYVNWKINSKRQPEKWKYER